MDEFVKLFLTMLAILVPVSIAGGIVALMASFAKRHRIAAPPPANPEDLSAILETLERMDVRLQQLEERVDFVERVLPGLRAGKPVPELPSPHSR
jgi:hypothetical protein